MEGKEKLYFPEGFLWGSSISSHQVEGGNNNNWTEWEKSEKRLEYLKKEGLLEKHGLDNFISGEATNHYHLYSSDLKIAKELNHNSLRISLEWSRIEPEEGVFNEDEIIHYKKLIKEMKELGIEPLVTLWHWTMPLWVSKVGGFENKNIVRCFEAYARRVVLELKDEVSIWITINEPEIYSNESYLEGHWPPQKKSILSYLIVLKNLILTHRRVYKAIHEIQPKAQVGISKNNIHFEPHQHIWFNKIFVKIAHWWWNDLFLIKIRNYQDFIGLNYYFRNTIHKGRVMNENKLVSDLGWEIHPEGIYHVLTNLKKYNKPIYITENGLADATDKLRSSFIAQMLAFIHKAIKEGVDVRGYLHWSLIDNFEWDKGFFPRFGLVEVDYRTKERKPRPSAHFYSKIIKNNYLNL